MTHGRSIEAGPRGDLRALAAPAAGFVGLGVVWGAFAAEVPALKAQIGASDTGFGLLMSASTLGLILSMLLAPRLDTALGRRGLPLAVALMGAAFMLPGFAGGPAAFGAAMLAVALASGLVDVIANARTAEAEARRGRPLMSAAHAAFSLTYAVAALGTGLAREAGAPPWAVLGVAGLAILFLAALAPSAAPEGAAAVGAGGRMRVPLAVTLCGAVVLLAFQIEGSVEQWSALHIERSLGGGAAEGALGPVALGLTMGIGRLAGQGLAGRLGRLPLIAGGAATTAAGAWIAAGAATPGTAYAGFAMLGLGLSVIGPLAIAEAGARAPAGMRARAVARAAVIGYAGFFVGPPLMGVVAGAASLPAAIAMLGGLALAAGALALALALRRL